MDIHVGEKINILCRKHRVKKKDVAEYAGITAAHLSQVISGRENPSQALLEKICDYFKIDMEYFRQPFYQQAVPYDKGGFSHLSNDLMEWIGKKEKKPYLILAKMIDEKDISGEEIAAIVEVLRSKKAL